VSQETPLTNKNTWKRILYMLLFALTYSVAEFVLITVAIVQVFFKLITGDTNDNLTRLGKQTALYIYDVMLFLTFNSENKPFPFSAWPEGKQ